jgi:hypothetical protein
MMTYAKLLETAGQLYRNEAVKHGVAPKAYWELSRRAYNQLKLDPYFLNSSFDTPSKETMLMGLPVEIKEHAIDNIRLINFRPEYTLNEIIDQQHSLECVNNITEEIIGVPCYENT